MWLVGRKQKVSDVVYLGDIAQLVAVFMSHCQLDNLILLHSSKKRADNRRYASAQSVGMRRKISSFNVRSLYITCYMPIFKILVFK